MAVLKAGACVPCEKPLGLSLAEYDDLAAAEAASGAYASVVFQRRYGSGAAHARARQSSDIHSELGRRRCERPVRVRIILT